MNRYSLLLTTIGIFWAGGGVIAQRAAVEPVQILEEEGMVGTDFDLGPDARRVYYFGRDWTMQRIDLDANKDDKSLPLPPKLRGEKIYAAVHVQDEVWLFAVQRTNRYEIEADRCRTRFVLYDFSADEIQGDWAAHRDEASALAFAPKQDWLITGGNWLDDHAVCFWDRKTLKKVGELDLTRELHLQSPRKDSWNQMDRMAIDPTSSFLAFEFHGGMIQIWDMEKKTWHSVIRDHKGCGMIDMRFINSRTLAAGWQEGVDSTSAEVYDWPTGSRLFRVEGHEELTDIAGSPDGRLIAVGDHNYARSVSRVRLWDVEAKREVASFKAYDGGMGKMTFTQDGKQLITSGGDGVIKVWDVEAILTKVPPAKAPSKED